MKEATIPVVSPLSGRQLEIPLSHARTANRRIRQRLSEAGLASPAGQRPSAPAATPIAAEVELQGPDPAPEPTPFHAGVYTLIGPKGHRTFRVQPVVRKAGDDPASFRAVNEGRLVLGVMTGTSNQFSYTQVSFVEEKTPPRVWKRHLGTELETLARVFWQFVVQGRVPSGYRIEFVKHCRICGLPLTTPKSLASGIGPECTKKAKDS